MKKYKVIKEIKGVNVKVGKEWKNDKENLTRILMANGFIEEVKENKRWRAEHGNKYYFFGSNIWTWDDLGLDSDNFLYNSGNYFKTEKEAEEYKEYLLADRKIKDWILENDEEGTDWKNFNKLKFYPIINYEYKKIDWGNSSIYKTNFYNVSSSELVQKLIKECEKELLIVFKIKICTQI